MPEYSSDHFEYSVEGSHPQLGSPIGELRGSWMRRGNSLGAFVFGGLLTALFTLTAIGSVDWQALLAGQADKQTGGALFCTVIFAVATLGCAYGFYWTVEGATLVVRLYSRGFAKQTFLTQGEVLWDDIASVGEHHVHTFQHGNLVGVHHRLQLRLSSGRKVTLDLSQIDGSETVAALVAENTLARLTAAAMDRLEKEGRATFGPLTVTKDELHQERLLGCARIAWGQIKKFELENGHLVIRTGEEWLGNWCHLGLACIPDFRVLLVLLEQMTNGPMSGSQFAQVSDRFRETGSMLAAWPGDR
jgi:hypothetical protein